MLRLFSLDCEDVDRYFNFTSKIESTELFLLVSLTNDYLLYIK